MRKHRKPEAKSWSEKLHATKPHEVVTLEKTFSGLPPGLKLLIPTPQIVDKFVREIPEGQFLSVSELRQKMAEAFHADHSCPLVTGIQLRIVAEAAWEQMKSGMDRSQVAPFWRVVHPASPLAKKLECPVYELSRLQMMEGIEPHHS